MEDISDQMLSGMKLNETVDPDAIKKMIIQRVGELITIHSDKIEQLLEVDPNAELYEMIYGYLTKVNDAKLSIADLELYLELSVHDTDGQIVTTFGISTDPNDPTAETVSKETYAGLKALAIDPEETEAKVKADLDTRKIY